MFSNFCVRSGLLWTFLRVRNCVSITALCLLFGYALTNLLNVSVLIIIDINGIKPSDSVTSTLSFTLGVGAFIVDSVYQI